MTDHPTLHTCARCGVADDWLPTADNVNALPDPVRKYIHDIETRCDPADAEQPRPAARLFGPVTAAYVAHTGGCCSRRIHGAGM